MDTATSSPTTSRSQRVAARAVKRYARRVAEGRCTKCGIKLIGEPTLKCEFCVEKDRKRRRLKKNRRRAAKLQRARYAKNPEPKRAATRAEKLRKKLTGECHDCTHPALPDSARCQPCRDRETERERNRYQTRRAA